MKFILIISFILLMTGCSENNSTPIENTSNNNENEPVTEENVDNNDNENTTEVAAAGVAEDNEEPGNNENEEAPEEEAQPDSDKEYPWDLYDDANKFLADAEDNVMYEPEDAPALEEAVSEAFQEQPDEETAYITTSQWSAFVSTFFVQMEEEFSDEYIEVLRELNLEIMDQATDGDIEDVQSLVDEAREIRESE